MKRNRFFLKAILFEGGIGVVALVLGFLFSMNLFGRVIFNFNIFMAVICFTMPLLTFYFHLRWLHFESIRVIERMIFEFYREYMSGFAIWQIAIISLVAGLGEELFFRGFLQAGIQELINGWAKNTVDDALFDLPTFYTAANLFFVSILFGAAHALTKMYFFIAFLISLYLGALLLFTNNNIIIPIGVHALYDFVVLTIVRWEVLRKQ
ncbi:MAG: CPBP family intramembrane metalloprotease [Planctomycetaceae bacterium]|jgi:membrane protease YdiL (CAAX protease family)|nr:CPBP family intramembrane metalloprotease [Planctomycetaceae bacterium]